MFDRNKGNKPDTNDNSASTSTSVESRPPASAGKQPAPSASGAKAAIGATIRIKGDISGDENLLIEGRVEGTVNLAAHELIIGRTGNVSADLTAKAIRVDGEVQGDINGKERVFLSSTSNTKGNIVTPRMTLEEGARFKGSIDIDPDHVGGSSSSSGGGGSPVARPVALDNKPGDSVAGKSS